MFEGLCTEEKRSIKKKAWYGKRKKTALAPPLKGAEKAGEKSSSGERPTNESLEIRKGKSRS